jgi:PKD repeat protein
MVSRISLAVLILGLLVETAGCTCEMPPDPPCSYGSCAGTDFGPPPVLPNGVIDLRYDSVTIGPGESVDFRSKVFCPPTASPCTYLWAFGNGQTSTLQNPGKIVFDKLGYYVVKLTVTDATGLTDPLPSKAYVAVWNGEFKDGFNRAEVEYDQYGWHRPLLYDELPLFSIESGWLKERGDWTTPGSTALMAWPLVKDVHVEVLQRRVPESQGDHFSDIIVRMHPSGGVSQFYRVRIWQEGTSAAGLEIAIFKISDGNDQHGILISDPTQPPSTRPTQCKACPYLPSYPRNKDFKIVVDVQGRHFHARLEDPAKPGVAILTSETDDPLEPPFLDEGLVGLTHFQGISHFEDFVMRKIGPLAPSEAGPDGPRDAGASYDGPRDAGASH